ncbi:hypothetical protein [Nitratidesulfovibrio sp. 1201_IL3209]|uniref:hypothetical protein n=1 Tax=Nitratidesulfovibrio sp. 1201_IL3209 TaxID=3084053 RepID=UPI002FDB7C8E
MPVRTPAVRVGRPPEWMRPAFHRHMVDGVVVWLDPAVKRLRWDEPARVRLRRFLWFS